MVKNVLLSALVSLSFLSGSASAFTLTAAKRTQGLKVNPDQSTFELVRLTGPGKFVSAQVSKQGGTTGLTFVTLIVDGQPLISTSYVAARNLGYGADNLFGVKLLDAPSGISNLTIGFGGLIEYKSSLVVSVTVSEPSVVQMIGNVISGQ